MERASGQPLDDVDDFGAIDAESDDLLLTSFEAHEAYERLLHDRTFLILGRKGSGKTAIYRRLVSEHDYRTMTIGYSFNEYPWHYHNLQQIQTGAEQERYLHSWKYLILITMAKVVLNVDQSLSVIEEKRETMRAIESFVVDTYGTRNPDVSDIFDTKKRVRGLKNLNIDFKFIKAELGSREVDMKTLPKLFPEVNRNLQSAIIDCLNEEHNYYVCFDELDTDFNLHARSTASV